MYITIILRTLQPLAHNDEMQLLNVVVQVSEFSPHIAQWPATAVVAPMVCYRSVSGFI